MFLNEQKLKANNRKRAVLIKNACLGLEKVENCHKVKAQRMKNETALRMLLTQCDRDQYFTSVNSFRYQEKTRCRLEGLINHSNVRIARVQGDGSHKLKHLIEKHKRSLEAEIAGPSKLEELIFSRLLNHRRERLINMRLPQNYSQRNKDNKSFWEEDEEYYRSFNGKAIANPLAELDGLMKNVTQKDETTFQSCSSMTRKLPKLSKSLSIVEKINFGSSLDHRSRITSAYPRRHRSTEHLPVVLPAKESQQTICTLEEDSDDVPREPLKLNLGQQNTLEGKVTRFLEEADVYTCTSRERDHLSILKKFEKPDKPSESCVRLLNTPELTASMRTSDWRNIYASSLVRSLTWHTPLYTK